MNAPSLFPSDESAADAPAPPARAVAPATASELSPAPAGATRSLYRKYRPQTFDDHDLVGQEPIVTTLRNAIRLDRVAHAYLFCGPRGTGKTTTARLLAKAVNCLDSDPDRRPCNVCVHCLAIAAGATTDIVEIDAASNRGIDDIRDLRERVKYAPAQLAVKFYIVDEAHQITGAAANAFLKTLEEPPAHTKFVLATTDPEELLPTIVSRCQRFDFRRISATAMRDRLQTVASAEGLTVDDEALAVITRHATGSLRDALGLLDQLVLHESVPAGDDAARPIRGDAVLAMLGVSRNERVETLVTALADRDASVALGIVNEAVEAGEDPRQINRQLVAYLRLLMHERAGGSPDADEHAKTLAKRFELAELAGLARRLSETDYAIKHSTYGQLPLEVALVDGVLREERASPGTRSRDTNVARPDTSFRAEAAPEAAAAPALSPAAGSTRLRDRVRGTTPVKAGETESPSSPAPKAPPATAPPTDTGRPPAPPTNGSAGFDVDRVADLWPRIRQDVKAVNRRIEALLSSVDPASVNGQHIVLESAYEFHRDKLNTDEVRAIVEEAVSRLVGGPVSVECQLRGEVVAPSPVVAVPPTASRGSSEVATEASGGPAVNGGSNAPTLVAVDGDADERRVRAAKNIFDAEEIDPPASEDPTRS